MMSSETKDEMIWVTPTIIQRLFNTGQYYERVISGEFTTVIRKERVPKRQKPGHPPGTRSQFVYYYDSDGNKLAGVHQYLLPDGTLGASGKPDPKYIFLPDCTVAVRARQKLDSLEESLDEVVQSQLEVRVTAFLSGHDLAPFRLVEDSDNKPTGYESHCRRCNQTVWVGLLGEIRSTLNSACSIDL